MAAGCLVLSSDLGALAETSLGFALLEPVSPDPKLHAHRFAERAVALLNHLRTNPVAVESFLQAQITAILHTNTWANRAKEWQRLFDQFDKG